MKSTRFAAVALLLLGAIATPGAAGAQTKVRFTLDWIPGARLYVIADAGHWPQWEKPGEFLRAHHDFLILGKDPE